MSTKRCPQCRKRYQPPGVHGYGAELCSTRCRGAYERRLIEEALPEIERNGFWDGEADPYYGSEAAIQDRALLRALAGGYNAVPVGPWSGGRPPPATRKPEAATCLCSDQWTRVCRLRQVASPTSPAPSNAPAPGSGIKASPRGSSKPPPEAKMSMKAPVVPL